MLMKTMRQRDERGMASFLITLFIMMVIGLIIIGFAQLTRRDQRQSLDRQLSVQANYAAETGINDAVRYLQTNPNFEKTDCGEASPGQLLSGYNNVLDAGSNISYSCVLIDATPGDLRKQDIGFSSNVVFPVQLASGAGINSITFQWAAKSASNTATSCPNAYNYPVNRNPACQIGLLRIDMVPYGLAASPSRTNFIDNLFTVFAHPVVGGPTSVGYTTNAGSNPTATDGGCSANVCTLTVSISGGTNRYFVRLNSIYALSDVTITANGGGPGNELVGAQAVIDSTGVASDVTKRIQVRIPLAGTDSLPGFAIQTQNSQCKRFANMPGNQIYAISPTDDCGF